MRMQKLYGGNVLGVIRAREIDLGESWSCENTTCTELHNLLQAYRFLNNLTGQESRDVPSFLFQLAPK